MSMDARKDSPRERLLADLDVQAEALENAPDRARAVERFMQTRAVLLRQRRGRALPATLSRAAAVAVCALSAGLVAHGWQPREAERERVEAVAVQPTFAAPAEATSSAEQSPKAIEEVRKPTAAAPGVKSGKAIEEIAVTARKREENLQETPVSISAFSAEDLRDADVRNLNDITRTVPNLQFDNPIGTANSARIYLRGVGPGDPISSNDLPRDPQSVADIEPVEVLRGPQGTLFGKNTIGGAVNVVTKKPEADATAPAPLDLATPIQLAPPSPERLRELQAQRGNDMAEVLPPLGSATLDPCASPERVGAAVPAEAADQASRVDARCPRDER